MNPDCVEPTVTLPSGAVVLQVIYEDISELLARGYRVWISEGGVLVWPAVHPDHLFLLDSNSRDVAEVLACDLGAIH